MDDGVQPVVQEHDETQSLEQQLQQLHQPESAAGLYTTGPVFESTPPEVLDQTPQQEAVDWVKKRGRPRGSLNKSTLVKISAGLRPPPIVQGERRKRGRPKGSKNRKTLEREQAGSAQQAAPAMPMPEVAPAVVMPPPPMPSTSAPQPAPQTSVKRRRGRPIGRRNRTPQERERARLEKEMAPPKKRGRPPGTSKKSTFLPPAPMNDIQQVGMAGLAQQNIMDGQPEDAEQASILNQQGSILTTPVSGGVLWDVSLTTAANLYLALPPGHQQDVVHNPNL